MIKQKKAFTLIELLLVTTILILLSVSWIFYFNDFISGLQLKTSINKTKNYIKTYDDRIKNKDLVDYEIHFKKNSYWFYDYENIFDTDKKQKISSINFKTWSWVINTTETNSEAWEIKIFWDNNFINKKFLDASKKFNYLFTWSLNYKISSKISWKEINNINLNYFSLNNIINLAEINSQPDKGGVSYNNFVIKNIWWKKKIYHNSTELNKIFLFFENTNWKQEILEIRK